MTNSSGQAVEMPAERKDDVQRESEKESKRICSKTADKVPKTKEKAKAVVIY